MFARIARVVGNLFTVVDDTKPSNRVRLACESLEDRCTPAGFVVNTAEDGNDSNLGDNEAGYTNAAGKFVTSLRSAIQQGNANVSKGDAKHTISFNRQEMKSNVISLVTVDKITKTPELPALDADYLINVAVTPAAEGDPPPEPLVVERPSNAATEFRIFDIKENRTVQIVNLHMRGGHTDGAGGGIQTGGNLTLSDCAIYDNTSQFGGGVSAFAGKLSVIKSHIYLNEAIAAGGGIQVASEVSEFRLEQSHVYSNGVGCDGGGVWTAAKSNFIAQTQMYGNSAGSNGGGLYAESRFNMFDCLIHGNSASSYGGGIYIETPQAAENLIAFGKLTSNTAGGKGGGFYLKSGKLVLREPAAISGNKATLGLAGGGYLPPATVTLIWANIPPGSQFPEDDQ